MTNNLQPENNSLWSEWDDSSLNVENWLGTVPVSSKGKTKIEKDVGSFIDPTGHGLMPPEFEVAGWKRPQEIDPNLNYCVAPETLNLEEFISNNTSLLNSDLLQTIILSYIYLDNVAQHSPFITEYQNPKFIPSFRGAWKPWYHIYSLCKAGQGQNHKPLFNQYGKYIVRFFMVGRWRRMVIDDFLPVDREGRVLLPETKFRNQLWLPLLTKALLKLALASSPNNFNVISSLTGWIEMPVPCVNMDKNILWKSLERHLKKDNGPKKDEQINSIEMCVTNPPYCIHQDLKIPTHYPYSPMILANFSKPQSCDSDGIKYGVIIDLKDDDQGLLNEENIVLERWKIFRWKEWAIKNRILKDSTNNPGRNLLILTPNNLRKVPFHVPGASVADEAEQDKPALNLLLWVKMETLTYFMRHLSFFYKPSEFRYSNHIDSLKEFLTDEFDPRVPKKPIVIEDNAANQISESNMCFYLVSDSLHCKIFFISFDGFYKYSDTIEEYSIIGEKFSWKNMSIGTVIFSIHPQSLQTVSILFGSGLQIVRIWCSVPKNYVLKIFSNSEFTLCGREKLYQIMTLPSITEKYFAGHSSSLFAVLKNNASNPRAHGEAFKKFIDSLEPKYFQKQVENWRDRFEIRMFILQTFEEVAVGMLLENKINTEDVLLCLSGFQRLFLNPVFGREFLKLKNKNLFDHYLNEEESIKQAKSIESYTSNLASSSSIKPKEWEKEPKTFDGNRNIQDLDLLFENPENMMTFFRKLFEKNSDIASYYPYKDCMESEMVFVEYSGLHNLEDADAILLLRYIINVDHVEKKTYIFQMFTNCKNGIALYNNDKHEIETPILNECAYFQLCHSKRGYTICVLKSERKSLKNVPWTLRIIGSRQYSLPYCFSLNYGRTDKPPSDLTRLTLEGFYVPDKDTNVFCKCILKVKNNCSVSLLLASSSLVTQLTLKVRGIDRKILAEINSIHLVPLPLLFLDISEGIESVDGDGWIFFVEGQVENNSWLLSEESKAALKNFKDCGLSEKMKSPARKLSILDFPEIDLLPTWSLRAGFDDEAVDPQLLPDTQFADEIRRQKEAWVSGDEDKRIEALESRQKFLADYPEDYGNALKSQLWGSDVKDTPIQSIQYISGTKALSEALLTESLLNEYSRVETHRDVKEYEKSSTLEEEDFGPTTEITEKMDKAFEYKISLKKQLEEYLESEISTNEVSKQTLNY